MKESKTIEKYIRDRKSTFVNGLKEGGKIDDSIIGKLLDNAIWAPTHGLVQAWEFRVFADEGVAMIFKKMQDIYQLSTPPERFNQAKYEKYLSKINRVSHVIAIIMRRDNKKRFPLQEDLVSVACAMQNIYLGLNEYDIAGYLSTGDICYAKEMSEFLHLNDEDRCLGFFILGLPDINTNRPPRKRIPAPEKTIWIRQ